MSRAHQEVNATFQLVADHLNRLSDGHWSWSPGPPDWPAGGKLADSSTGMVFHVRNSVDRKDAYSVSAESPKDSRGQVPYVTSRTLPRINVAHIKTSSQIAGDVARRLVPEWLPLYEQAIAAIKESNQYTLTTGDIAAEISRLTRGKVQRDRPNQVSFPTEPHESNAEVYGDHVQLTLRITHEDALDLLEHLFKS